MREEGERESDPQVELAYKRDRELAAKATAISKLKVAVSGWALLIAGIVYAFQFESPIGFLVAAVGGGVLAIKEAKSFLGR